MNILAVIPARHGSTRFPGKPLASVAGLPMVQRVYTRVATSGACDKVVVATDDERIASVVREFGGHVVMTSQDCPNGTMRCHEAVVALEAEGAHVDAVLNIQGDEPFVHPKQVTQLADMLRKPDAAVVTLAKSMPADPEIHSPHRVKVVRNLKGRAQMFSLGFLERVQCSRGGPLPGAPSRFTKFRTSGRYCRKGSAPFL